MSLTIEELRAIHGLESLAAKWPDSLMLFSCSGSLVVVPVRDLAAEGGFWEDDTVTIRGIRNDGGDPESLGYRSGAEPTS